MSYFPFMASSATQVGSHISMLKGLETDKSDIRGCILHDDSALLGSIPGAKVLETGDDIRFRVFYVEVEKGKVLLIESGLGCAQTSVIIFKIAAALGSKVPIVKVGTCGILDDHLRPGCVLVTPAAVAAEGVTLWNAPEFERVPLVQHIINAPAISVEYGMTERLIQYIGKTEIEFIKEKRIVSTDALYSLYNKPSILGEMENLGICAIEMELSAFYSTCNAVGSSCAAFIVGSWTLDQQLRFAAGLDPERPNSQAQSVRDVETALVSVICDAFGQLGDLNSDRVSSSAAVPNINGKSPPPIEMEEFFCKSLDTFKNHSFHIRSISVRVPMLAEGYVYISGINRVEDRNAFSNAVVSGKTIVIKSSCSADTKIIIDMCMSTPGLPEECPTLVIYHDNDETMLHTREDLKAVDISKFDKSLIFVLSDQYLLRRYLQLSAQKKNILLSASIRKFIPDQRITMIGLPPHSMYLSSAILDLIGSIKHVVAYDRTVSNIIRNRNVVHSLYIVPYDYEDFANNLLNINTALSELHAKGVYEAGVLIEGNPEIYDFAEGLSWDAREFQFTPALPLIYVSCRWIEAAFKISILDQGYALSSGFNVRHGIVTKSLVDELQRLLETQLSVLVMEMYCGDLSNVISSIKKCGQAKYKEVIILTNMFSPEQNIWYISSDGQLETENINRIKGKFTTLVVVDKRSCGPTDGLSSLKNLMPVVR